MVKSQASFRGVEFKVASADTTAGRRTVTHNYPMRDQAYVEDLGKSARTFTVEGYVVGADFVAARNALLTALEQPGSGTLVHPYYGTKTVSVTAPVRVRESGDRSGIAYFTIEFTETPAKPVQPTAVVDAPAKVVASGTKFRESTRLEFLAKYNAGALSASVTESLRSATLTLDNNVNNARLTPQALARLKTATAGFISSLGAVVNAPNDLFAGLSGMIDIIESIPALLKLYLFNPGTRPPATTARRAEEQANFDAVQRVVQRLATVRAAELAPTQTFDNYTAAVAARDAITAVLDEQAETVGDDTYPALVQLRADLVKAVPGDSSTLPRLVSYTPLSAVPSLVLAHQLYGNIDLEPDLVLRNRIRNPALILGGKRLEVLSDAS